MGFRFRRSIRLLPGVRVNLSRRGASLSVGRPGASVNVNERGVQTTVGLPGSGLSYSTSRARWGQLTGGSSLTVFIRAVIVLAAVAAVIIVMAR